MDERTVGGRSPGIPSRVPVVTDLSLRELRRRADEDTRTGDAAPALVAAAPTGVEVSAFNSSI